MSSSDIEIILPSKAKDKGKQKAIEIPSSDSDEAEAAPAPPAPKRVSLCYTTRLRCSNDAYLPRSRTISLKPALDLRADGGEKAEKFDAMLAKLKQNLAAVTEPAAGSKRSFDDGPSGSKAKPKAAQPPPVQQRHADEYELAASDEEADKQPKKKARKVRFAKRPLALLSQPSIL